MTEEIQKTKPHKPSRRAMVSILQEILRGDAVSDDMRDLIRTTLGETLSDAPKKPKKLRTPSRPQRWADAASSAAAALSELKDVQQEYQDWYDNMPESLQSSPLGEKLSAICELDIESAHSTADEAESAELPMGFGRD